MYESLLLFSLVVCSMLIGLVVTLVIVILHFRHLLLESVQSCDTIKKEFQESIAKAADINNGMVRQIAQMQDQILAHEMLIKGGRK